MGHRGGGRRQQARAIINRNPRMQSQPPVSNRMRIRSFPAAMDEKYVEQVWEMLKKAIQEIQHKNNSGLSFEELYRNAYTMVLHKFGQKLYMGLKQVVEEHLTNHVRPKIVEAFDSGNFLEVINEAWSDHTTAMMMIRDILMYMDRVYVELKKVEPVYHLGLEIFRDQILYQDFIHLHLRTTLLSLIQQERHGAVVNWIGIKNACQMLISLGIHSHKIYTNEFEAPFLVSTADYYHTLSMSYLVVNTASLYVKRVEHWIREESERAKRYLDPQTESKLLDVLEHVLINEHMHTIVNMEHSGVHVMLDNDRYDDLASLYTLLQRAEGGLEIMGDAISRYLRKTGASTVKEDRQRTPIGFIEDLLDLKERFDEFLLMSFQRDKAFKNIIQAEFETFINLNKNSPEYLSLYMDENLRKGVKTENEENAEKLLDRAMVLFRFLQEKDVFEKYYKQHMARRLLLDRSLSDDMERMMISKLKTECGYQFTLRLENMYRDKELWSTHATAFRKFSDSLPDEKVIDISVRVLTAGVWPTQSAPVCILPPVCEHAFNTFTNFYVTKHNGRKLTLNTMLGTADVKAVFYGSNAGKPGPSDAPEPEKEETKILMVNTHQMVILMCFNNQPRLTYQDLREQTRIAEKELKRNLQSLAMGKLTQRILCRKGKGIDLDALDEFSVNDGFQSKLTRIKVQLVTVKAETEPEKKQTRTEVEDDRKHEVEAAIVRVMKSRKSLTHNNLVTEVTQQLKQRFTPTPQLIKKRVEALIERDYLARDAQDLKLYNYIA
ncbi:unnamed protein product [Cylicocyclus nassatus]|uniref:Cullin family profile domain-containing protein n=1 Tax=Cylicocyclus nassatus TaxID=53992 RepID=A0AA36HF79_CYLNA|nr:unnamed protein product [Cylicocyclus nassatus]